MERRHFFISRAGGNSEFAAFLCKLLSATGYSYHEQKQWPEGVSFVAAISDALESVEYTIALFSPEYWERKYTNHEWEAAFNRCKLIPVLITKCKLPALLEATSYVDLTRAGSPEEKAEVFLTALAKRTYELPMNEGGWRPPLESKPAKPAKTTDLLPFLCDREDQEPAMMQALQGSDGRAVVFVVGAEDEHRPDKVRERLTNVTIPLHLAGKEPYIRPTKYIAWPTTQNVDEFRGRLDMAKRESGLNGFAPEDVIVVATDVVIEKSSEDALPQLLREYINFWRGISVGKGCLFVVCLSISYRSQGLMNFFRFGKARTTAREEVEKLRGEEGAVGCKVLPPLKMVPRQQVQNWSQLPVVQAKAAIDLDDIIQMFDGRGVYEISMKELAPQLKALLQTRGN